MKKKIAAIIQARMTSNRLPGKVLMDIEKKPILWHVINRLRFSKKLNDIILAIPDTKENDILEKFAKDNKIKYFRGSENDVLSRYYEAAKRFKCDIIVRITSDCPLIDPKIVDVVIKKHLSSGVDYTSNVQLRTYPKGMDVETLNFQALEKSFYEAKDPVDREHVTLYIRRHPSIFKQASAVNNQNLSPMRWTVDEKEDLDFVRKIYEKLYREGKIFLMQEILELLEKEPRLSEINKNIRRKPI
jgi:spore coat polysaccharide biosynthesis protein SpsF (cytidylyltransferase family)